MLPRNVNLIVVKSRLSKGQQRWWKNKDRQVFVICAVEDP